MELGVILTGVGFILLLIVISWVLAHLARRLPDGIPRAVKISISGPLLPVVLLVLGHSSFVEEESFIEWALSRPPRAYILVPGCLLFCTLAAWFVLRDRGGKLDVSTFE